MNRILATTLLAALAFTGCMKDNSEEYKKQQQVIPGVDIYSSAMVQQNVSTQMAEAGLRLASLLAEAKTQYPDTPLEEINLSDIEVKVWDDTRPLQLLLFGDGEFLFDREAGEVGLHDGYSYFRFGFAVCSEHYERDSRRQEQEGE